jgi:hypothetical protein
MEIKVVVYRRPNMFNVAESLLSEVGVGELKNLYTIEGWRTEQHSLKLFYPERFLNILEQRSLLARCEAAGYTTLHITTHSVYIIQCCTKGTVFITQDELIQEGSGFKLSNDDVGMCL